MTRVVVADDDHAICELVKIRLERSGYIVDTFHDGAVALGAMLAEPPDVAILDIRMPFTDGLAVLRAMRANPATVDVPVILFTGSVDEHEREAGYAAGTEHYIVKPFSINALALYVDTILNE